MRTCTRTALRWSLYGALWLVGCGPGTIRTGSPFGDASSPSAADGDTPLADGGSRRDASVGNEPGADGSSEPGPGGGDGGRADAGPGQVVLGGPGCGFSAAAFCDTFDAPGASRGRAGELDARHWSASRLAPQLPSGGEGIAIGIGPGPMPSDCRSDLPSAVFPDQDAVICDPTPGVASNHLLVVASAQNYGQNSYRIRQPFDFAGRTGHVVFDAEATAAPLLGWISLEITEDPVNAPSFAFGGEGVANDEGSLIPRRAVEFQFQNPCDGYVTESSVSLRAIALYEDYQLTMLQAPTPTCVRTEAGKLNHFDIAISAQRLEVRATPFSADGRSFGNPVLIYGADVNLPFTRGYVHITTHNHATLKYSSESVQAWTARWDNVGFDGPVISSTREAEAPDSLTRGTDAWNRKGPVVNVGYRVPDRSSASPLSLTLPGVDSSGVRSAVLSLSTWWLVSGGTPSSYALRYRLNGGAWHDRPLTAGEVGRLTSSQSQGQIGQIVDIDPTELRTGDNQLELTTVNAPQSYPPVAANVDLVMRTD